MNKLFNEKVIYTFQYTPVTYDWKSREIVASVPTAFHKEFKSPTKAIDFANKYFKKTAGNYDHMDVMYDPAMNPKCLERCVQTVATFTNQ